ncbi:MAG TPA: hypothetical protein VFL14_05410 [Xanthomonadales bacterium]|nr:hypothetical protein [Xanthomonadales bacterium]
MSAEIVCFDREDEILPGQFCPIEKSKAATASVSGDPLHATRLRQLAARRECDQGVPLEQVLQRIREKAPERHIALLLALRGGALG